MADQTGTNYKKMPTDVDEDKIDRSQRVLASRNLEAPEAVAEEPAPVMEEAEPKGLMARRNTDGI